MQTKPTDAATQKYPRFTISDRIEHWVQFLSFTTLALTGLVQKFPESPISQQIVLWLGGIETTRIIHRTSAVVLMLAVVYHIGTLGYKFYVLRRSPAILPGKTDFRAFWQMVLYNLGRRTHRPQEGRYTFAEKVEYWAFVWGTVIMALTGFMMWNPIATARVFPGQFIPAAKAAHGFEAILAVLAVLVWHIYGVHLKHFNRSMFTGHLNEEEMLEEHPLELADIKAGTARRVLDLERVKDRRRIFIPVFGVIALVLLAGIYSFVTFEETAITTLPPAEQVEIFAPLTPTPFPTPLPTKPPPEVAVVTWEGGIGDLFQDRCGVCHNSSNTSGGLDLSSYTTTLAGGNTGPGIVPGDQEASTIIQRQAAGNHPGQLNAEELVLLGDWIEAGAPEN